jgi:hypothetical protein
VTIVVIWKPNQIFEIGKRGRDLEREIAPSLSGDLSIPIGKHPASTRQLFTLVKEN